MIGAAMKALRAMQLDALATDVVYRRGGLAVAVKAVVGRTWTRSTNEYGEWVKTPMRDYIVPEGQFAFFPEPGDLVEDGGSTYEVLALGSEPCWRWSDPCRTAMRIHTKEIGGKG